jgi:hypothetical protein
MYLASANVLLIPALDWRHVRPAAKPPGRKPAPRLPSALGWMLAQLRERAAHATVGMFGESLTRWPDLAHRVIDAGCELAAMTWDAVDPWAMPAGALSDQVAQTIAAAKDLGLRAPTTFLPPLPVNQILDPPRIAALREAGIMRLAGCRGAGFPAVLLAEWAGLPLTGALIRVLPVILTRSALARQPGAACAVSPLDIDPGAPGHAFGRTRAMRRFPHLLQRGFITAAEAEAISLKGPHQK